jgi:hypothetical protein
LKQIQEAREMKYMIMMFGSSESMMEAKPVEWIREMIQFMRSLNDDLSNAGELVAAEGLTDGSQAKTVSFQNGIPVVTDGPFAEAKESIIGYWIVDVENQARALDIAKRVVAFTQGPIEVRQVMDRPPEV